ncbi:MAG: toprim domain-containing protein [Nitrososphaerota archaeon]|jgi:5S rRNA maturation endonuclease (ribonuclease M5)|nr:toprim domain-containing protein [Nitrososphaerota archaeon]
MIPVHLRDRLERIDAVIGRLVEYALQGKLVVVEGKKDVVALSLLGVVGRVLAVKAGGRSFLQVAEEIEALGVEEIILLLDFDRRGREGTWCLQRALERTSVRVNVVVWRELAGLVGRDVQDVEGLPAFLATIAQKVGG